MTPTGGRRARRLVAMVTTAGVAGCGGPVRAPELPVPASVVDVDMSDFAFGHTPATLAGRIVVRARNVGRSPHEIVLVELPEDLPRTIDEQLRGPERMGFPSVAYLPVHPPDTTGSFAIDLTPGRYAFICFVKDGEGREHARLGMSSELRVG